MARWCATLKIQNTMMNIAKRIPEGPPSSERETSRYRTVCAMRMTRRRMLYSTVDRKESRARIRDSVTNHECKQNMLKQTNSKSKDSKTRYTAPNPPTDATHDATRKPTHAHSQEARASTSREEVSVAARKRWDQKGICLQ